MKKILVPIDGSKCSQLAMQKAKELAKAFDSSITVITVV
ncbi:universal stress protein, partial [Vibrio parahaemolyticus]|nr:universal stress protein [Vibrio parahaemolyticus]